MDRLLNQVAAFHYVTAPNAPTYRAVVHVFHEARQAVSRIDDFYKGRYVYHLTSVGEAAHRSVLEVEATVGKSGSLQATMLVKIREALGALSTAGAGAADPDTVVRLLHDLHSAFDTLTGGRSDSDVDLLVEYMPGRSGFGFVEFCERVEQLLGRRVDVVTEKSLHPVVRDDILAQAVPL